MLQSVCNKLLALDPDLHLYMQPLNGRHIAIVCTNYNIPITYITFENSQILFSSSAPQNTDLTISGRVQDFVYFALSKQRSSLQITGDMHLAANLEKLYLRMDLDWEEELSKHTGSIFAHQAVYWFTQFKDYTQSSTASFSEMVVEHLQNDGDALPTDYEVNAFMQDVDELRLRVDRLEARIKEYEAN